MTLPCISSARVWRTVHMTLDGSLTSFNAEQLKQVQQEALEELRL